MNLSQFKILLLSFVIAFNTVSAEQPGICSEETLLLEDKIYKLSGGKRCHWTAKSDLKRFKDKGKNFEIAYPDCMTLAAGKQFMSFRQKNSEVLLVDGSTTESEDFVPLGGPSPLSLNIGIVEKDKYTHERFLEYGMQTPLVPTKHDLTVSGKSAIAYYYQPGGPEMEQSYVRIVEIERGNKMIVLDFRYSFNGYNSRCCKTIPAKCACDRNPDFRSPHRLDLDIQCFLKSFKLL